MSSSVSKSYRRNQPAEEWGNFDTENYPFYAFKSLTTLTSDPEHYKTYADVPDETAVKKAKGSSVSRHTAYMVIGGTAHIKEEVN